ncbi:putative type IX secretion system sortase PorU2 [Hymenobacter swuensis]|uniref:Gingipain domain-containing protein n=1 Tax=Hymenobacter swuensis DY53 TaxID=1227739 RepID=W8EUK5_9BACT|nr:C25 family cysteine peptidase [Hymenobacter swuensis]AHJ96889.1 hypothetical protein Hsw_1294 [Hymenobacter swuensis DY53]
MKQAYQKLWLLALLLLTLWAPAAQAQSGPYGNEWIVPGQQYYKIKVARDGLYRLNYQYLQQAGISGVNPQRLQLWRRGKEVAIHVGGNTTALDNSTFIEFFGQRNDAALDRALYKNAADQTHTLYSLYTDTASYFLTWSATTNGRRMEQPAPVAGSAIHTHWLKPALTVYRNAYSDVDKQVYSYSPWLDAGEGFLSRPVGSGSDPFGGVPVTQTFSSPTTREVATQGNLMVEMVLVGTTRFNHAGTIYVVGAAGERQLGTYQLTAYNKVVLRYPLQRTDIAANGRVQIRLLADVSNSTTNTPTHVRVGYIRVTYPQIAQWTAGQDSVSLRNDSTLTGPAYYQLSGAPTSVMGYDVTDPYNVQRIVGTAGTQRSYVFPAANNRTRSLMLADAAQLPEPAQPLKRVQFRAISAAAHNFIIITSRVLMKPAGTGTGAVTDAVRAYATYRASTIGGGWDTLVVTSEQLYDQFYYGDKSVLALRQFSLWMLNGSTRPKSLLLLGKGLGAGEYDCGAYHRQVPDQYGSCRPGNPAVVRNLVPINARGLSDNLLTADWQNNQYTARMTTGRISAQNAQDVLNYLNKLREHEALSYEPWRRNVIQLNGPREPYQIPLFDSFLATYATFMRKPPFAANIVKTYRRADYPGTIPGETAPLNLAQDFNNGVSLVSYFGHGDATRLAWNIANINDAANGFANKGKYPVWYVSGCSAGNSFRGIRSFGGDDYLLAADKGIIGFLCESDLGLETDLHLMHTEMVKLLFSDNTWYGRPIAEVQQEVSRRLQPAANSTGQDNLISMLMNTIWQGDPALKLFSPLQPDFQTSDARLQISLPAPATANASFELKLGVSNPGRITTGLLTIRVTRTVGSGTPVVVNFRVPQARQDTTYTLALTNPATGSVAGQNTFQVDLDPDNLIAESDETNNRATLNYTFLTGGVTTLSPPEFAIVGNRAVRLVAQSNVPTITARDYDLELDTVQTFTSALVQRTKVNAIMVPEWQPTLPTLAGQDSVVWYWRVRLNAPQGDESANWATSSFRVINGRTQGGWSQSHPGQFRRDERAGVEVAVPGGQWTFNGATQEATITSNRIGPARQWETLYHTIRTSATGDYTLRLLGTDTLGATTVLNANVTDRAFALSGVSAKLYPYLQLQAVLRESTAGVTPQLEQWLVTYQGVPEGVVRPSATPLTAAALTQQAQRTGTLTIPVTFQNVADYTFTAPLVGYVVVRSSNAGAPRERYYPLAGAALTAHSQREYSVRLDVRGLFGTLSGQVVLNPRRQPEQHYFNNELTLPPFEVTNNDTPPVLDVAFDGRHLLNGEIVSPQPIISIQLRDIDKLRPIRDRSNFIVVLTPKKTGVPMTVDMNSSGIVFVADSAQGTARLEYQPGKTKGLEAGVYTLEVQGRDGSGNLAGTEPYRITFEVITESTITNVFPYPNPVTSKTKFVFTLTGSTLPRNMKIQIVSLTGRVVKEIMMADLGPLRIGNNITEYAWDGTDDYGDRLANGTYLYRVVLDDPSGEFKQRATGGDRAFKKDWGKLVLLR